MSADCDFFYFEVVFYLPGLKSTYCFFVWIVRQPVWQQGHNSILCICLAVLLIPVARVYFEKSGKYNNKTLTIGRQYPFVRVSLLKVSYFN